MWWCTLARWQTTQVSAQYLTSFFSLSQTNLAATNLCNAFLPGWERPSTALKTSCHYPVGMMGRGWPVETSHRSIFQQQPSTS